MPAVRIVIGVRRTDSQARSLSTTTVGPVQSSLPIASEEDALWFAHGARVYVDVVHAGERH